MTLSSADGLRGRVEGAEQRQERALILVQVLIIAAQDVMHTHILVSSAVGVGGATAVPGPRMTGSSARLAVSGPGQVIHIYDVNTATILHSIATDGAATKLAFSPANDLLAATVCQTFNIELTAGCWLQLIDVATGTTRYISPRFEEAIYALAFHPGGTFIATAHGRIQVHFYDGRSRENSVRLWGVPSTEP